MQKGARWVNQEGWDTYTVGDTKPESELCRGPEEEADDGSVCVPQPATSQAAPWLQVPQGVKVH